MNDQQLEFIEKIGVFGAENGTQRSVARIAGYLLVCEPKAQSAKQIQEALKISAGSVNNALTTLRSHGTIKPVSKSGTRSLLFEIDPQSWKQRFEQRLKIVPDTIAMIDAGLILDPKNERLLIVRRAYESIEREVATVLKKLKDI